MRVRRVNRKYSQEFIDDAVALAQRSDMPFKQIGRDLGVSHWTLRGWYNKAEMAKKKGKPKGVPASGETAEEKAARLEQENERLRKEVDSLKTDREILKKAAAFFAKESE